MYITGGPQNSNHYRITINHSGVPRYSVISTFCKSFVFSTNWRVWA